MFLLYSNCCSTIFYGSFLIAGRRLPNMLVLQSLLLSIGINAVTYLKNVITSYWLPRHDGNTPDSQVNGILYNAIVRYYCLKYLLFILPLLLGKSISFVTVSFVRTMHYVLRAFSQ